MIEFCDNNKIDIAMKSETNCRWTTRTAYLMSYEMKALWRETTCHHTDSKSQKPTNTEWSQGGLMNAITGRMSSLI